MMNLYTIETDGPQLAKKAIPEMTTILHSIHWRNAVKSKCECSCFCDSACSIDAWFIVSSNNHIPRPRLLLLLLLLYLKIKMNRWWDEYGCLQSSPKVIEFEYTIDLVELAEPTNCQDADAIAKRMQDAMASAMPGGTTILVVGLGGITIENDVALGTTQCGGTISGGYQGDYSTASDYSDPPGTTTSVTFRVSTDCPSSGCTDAQSVQSLYDTTLQSMLAYAQGSMTQDIVSSADRNPAVPQLQYIVVNSATMTSDGTYTNPLNDEDSLIEATSFTVEAELSVTGFDTSSFDAAEKAEAISFFQAALETTLASEGLSYPVKVTDIVDGKIMYETFITADSASEASAAASSIETELAEDARRATIASNAVSEASGSSIASTFSSGFTIDASTQTAITEIPVAKLIVEGQFLTSQTSFGSSDESYLEKAIYEVLLDQGVLSEGGRVEVTGYDGGLITYEVISYVDATSNVKSKADSIASQIVQSSTTDQIASAANSSPDCCTPVAFAVFESTYLSTSGVPSRGWWPDWDFGEMTCSSSGKAPAYMNRSYGTYFSASKRECCEQWFPYNLKGCVGPSIEGSTKELFVPNWAEYHCESKQEGEMDDWELADSFGSLEECCKERFSSSFSDCCSSSGSNECSLSSEILYFPREGKCIQGVESAMEPYEIAFSESSIRECCASNFWWMTLRVCCSNSGGC